MYILIRLGHPYSTNTTSQIHSSNLMFRNKLNKQNLIN